MSSLQESNLPNPSSESQSPQRTLLIEPESQQKREKSMKSVKSPVSIQSGLKIRSSGGMFNFDIGQGLATMEKKKEKLEQLCAVMSNRKQEIAEKQQLLSAELGKIRILQEQKVVQNISGTSGNQAIEEIQKIVESKNKRQSQLEQSIESITAELRARKSQEQEEVGILIKQTSELTTEVSSLDKQIEVARKKTTSLNSSTTRPHVSGPSLQQYQQQVTKLQRAVEERQKEAELIRERRTKQQKQRSQKTKSEQIEVQRLKKVKEEQEQKIRGLLGEGQKQQTDLQKSIADEKRNYEDRLKQLKEKSQRISIPAADDASTGAKEDQQRLLSEIKNLEGRVSSVDSSKLQERIREIEAQCDNLAKNNSNIKQDKTDTQTKKQQIHNLSQKISQLNQDLKTLTEYTKTIAKTKDQAASVLITEKEKYEASLKENEHHQLQTDVDRLKRRLKEEKNEYSRLESLNKEFVPASMIEQYKDKNSKYKEELKELTESKNQMQKTSRALVELKEQKSRLEWKDNQQALELDTAIKNFKTRRDQMLIQNKDLGKKLTQAQAKVKQYKESYPDFEIKGEKKGNKKKILKPEDTEVKELKEVKETKEVKRVDSKKDEKKSQKKEQKKEQQSQSIPEKVSEIKETTQLEKSQSTPVKPKKGKKKLAQTKDEQTLINEILDQHSEGEDAPLVKASSTNSANSKKKEKEKEKEKGKKSSNNPNNGAAKSKEGGKSKMEQQIQFLMQSTKQQAPKASLRAPPLIIGLIVLLSGSAYWFFS